MPHMIPAFEFRRRAREAMKRCMPVLLVVALIATLPSLLSTVVTVLTGADPNVLMENYSNRITQVMEQHGLMDNTAVLDRPELDMSLLEADMNAAMSFFQEEITTFLQEKGLVIGLMAALVLVASPVLTMGLINALLHALRGKEVDASIALSRVRYLPKALGLELLTALKVLLWMLPGMAVSLLALILPAAAAMLLMVVGTATMMIPAVMASYRYALAPFLMADDPTLGVRACIRRSCEVMQRRKLELFSLEISFIGWRLLLDMVQSLLLGMMGNVIGATLGMFAALFLTVYTNGAKTAFYQAYAVGPLPQGEDTAANTEEMAD